MSLSEVEKLFKEHFHCAVYTAQTIVSSKEVAEDIVQNVFIKMLDINTKEVKVPARFLYTCVRNAALDYSRTHAYSLRAMTNFKMAGEIELEEEECFDYLPATEADKLSRLRRVFAAVEQLPPRTREVVKHIYFNERSYQETADMLGVSLATVKSHMYQSFKMLREKLAALHQNSKHKKTAKF